MLFLSLKDSSNIKEEKLYFAPVSHRLMHQTAINIFNDNKLLGSGIKTFRYLCKDEKTILIEDYFNTYPGIKKYIDDTIHKAYSDGYVSTLNGRKRKCRFSTNKMVNKAEERAAINMPIQGTAAELIKIAMINLENDIKRNGLSSLTLIFLSFGKYLNSIKSPLNNLGTLVAFILD